MAPTLPLPLVLSIPHAGLDVPPELDGLLALDARDLYNECDLWADQLFDPAPGVLARVRTPIARAIVDVNRPPDDLDDPDGPIKAQTSYGVQNFAAPLPRAQRIALRERYWAAYHRDLGAALARHAGALRLLLDCHNMAQRGPTTYAFAGKARPLICLANLGDRAGEPKDGAPVTCPPTLLRRAGELAADLFADMTLLELDGDQPPVVALNYPFAGGYIIRRYTSATNESSDAVVPRAPMSIMVEVNRGLFVGNQHAATPVAPPNTVRIAAIRSRLARWAEALCAELEAHS